MFNSIRSIIFLGLLLSVVCASAENPSPIPVDFPQFIVPGQEKPMASMREIYWLHYQPAGPMATLWDEWLSGSSLWPAVETGDRMNVLRKQWSDALSARRMDAEGYVATHQHPSIAHQEGWPFPSWVQGQPATWGWHFVIPGPIYAWGDAHAKSQEGWILTGGTDRGIDKEAWNCELTSPGATLKTPPLVFQADNAPFIQIRWRAAGLENAQPWLEWTTEEKGDFAPDRRFYFQPVKESDGLLFTMIPVFKSAEWRGKITRLAIHFDNPAGAKVGVQALFTQYDTRHNINNQNFIRGCCQYFDWTRDLNFLRANLQRMRLAQLYMMESLGGRKEKCILAPFVGHDGKSGLELTPDGRKILHPGHGIGNDYWDLLPMGYKDCYATIHYYDSLNAMARLEREIDAHPEWNLPGGPLRVAPDEIRRHAEEVKAFAGKLFWNDKTGRFVAGIDVDGQSHDYGYTFINLEAIDYGFAAPEQAGSIMNWMTGARSVEGDTSQGSDLYHWRFGPRATTRRNVEWYFWAWSGPETIPWGYQVQDGGAVFGFSYHDLLARLKILGPDNAWERLKEIIAWFDEVQAAGGYRAYYKDGTRGTLQGGGPPGGLGLDQEFFESILVPQIMLNGFLGFRPRADGFDLDPRLPKDWPEFTVTRIHFHRNILEITIRGSSVLIKASGPAEENPTVRLPEEKWRKWSITTENFPAKTAKILNE